MKGKLLLSHKHTEGRKRTAEENKVSQEGQEASDDYLAGPGRSHAGPLTGCGRKEKGVFKPRSRPPRPRIHDNTERRKENAPEEK